LSIGRDDKHAITIQTSSRAAKSTTLRRIAYARRTGGSLLVTVTVTGIQTVVGVKAMIVVEKTILT
jgi:hypothetical protein